MARETADLRALDETRLKERLEEAHQALFNLRFQAATRQLANVAEISKARTRIARVRTLMREREILAAHDAAVAGTPRSGEE